jgi:hypothetical protein
VIEFESTPKALANFNSELTPKAFANFSPGLERSDNPGKKLNNNRFNPERVRRERNPFRVQSIFLYAYPGFSLRSNPGLKLANAFGVNQSAAKESKRCERIKALRK